MIKCKKSVKSVVNILFRINFILIKRYAVLKVASLNAEKDTRLPMTSYGEKTILIITRNI
ncbi:MAG: hypothetical protein WC614_07015 [bacterium]